LEYIYIYYQRERERENRDDNAKTALRKPR
jgi:hypothetical protein